MRISASLISLCIFILNVGCQAKSENLEATLQSTPSGEPSDFSVIVTVYPVETMSPIITIQPTEMPSLDPTLNAIVSLVKNDLKEKTGVGLEKIHILEIEAVEWPDSSLGCGQPGEVYMPVITPGFRILLEVDGQVYSYHTNTTNRFILCEMPKPILINPTP
jgi:hypothetical protein